MAIDLSFPLVQVEFREEKKLSLLFLNLCCKNIAFNILIVNSPEKKRNELQALIIISAQRSVHEFKLRVHIEPSSLSNNQAFISYLNIFLMDLTTCPEEIIYLTTFYIIGLM